MTTGKDWSPTTEKGTPLFIWLETRHESDKLTINVLMARSFKLGELTWWDQNGRVHDTPTHWRYQT